MAEAPVIWVTFRKAALQAARAEQAPARRRAGRRGPWEGPGLRLARAPLLSGWTPNPRLL